MATARIRIAQLAGVDLQGKGRDAPIGLHLQQPADERSPGGARHANLVPRLHQPQLDSLAVQHDRTIRRNIEDGRTDREQDADLPSDGIYPLNRSFDLLGVRTG